MNHKHKQSIYHANVNLMVKNVIQINSRIMINVNVNAKSIIYVKNIIFEILVHLVLKW